MSENKMNINVSGGNNNFGNLSQGDNTNLQSDFNLTLNAKAFDDFFSELNKLSDKNIAELQINELKHDIHLLKTQLLNKTSSTASFSEKIKTLYEKYAWAGELLAKLFGKLV